MFLCLFIGLAVSASPAEDKYRLASQLLSEGNARMAVYFCDQAIDLNENYWPAYLKRGDALARLGQKRLAADDYKKVLKLYPDNKDAISRLGGCMSIVSCKKPPIACHKLVRSVHNKKLGGKRKHIRKQCIQGMHANALKLSFPSKN